MRGLFILAIIAAPGGAGASGSAMPMNSGDIGPSADSIDDLINVLKDIKEKLDDAHTTIGTSLGPPAEPLLSDVVGYLTVTETLVDDVMNGNVYPSLNPPHVGSIDPAMAPTTLPGHSGECVRLIQAAITELKELSPDQDIVGTKLKTIISLLPDYRAEAGIERSPPPQPLPGSG